MLTRSQTPEEEIKKAMELRDEQKKYIDSLGEWITEFYNYGGN